VKMRSVAASIFAISFGFICVFTRVDLATASGGGQAKAAEIHALISNGMKAPMEAIRAQAEQAIGHPLNIEYDASLELKPKIEAGEFFDVALLTPQALDDLIKQGKIEAGSRVDVARVPVAIGQRGNGPKPDISTLDALKRALLRATYIRYVPNGASLAVIKETFRRLGIVEEMKAKTVSGTAPTTLAPGETELNITLASEILPNRDLVFLGVLPAEVQVPAVMSVGISAKASDPKAANALIKFLQGPAIEPFLKANGMQR